MSRFLAIDWGTTNRRIFLIEKGVAESVHRDNVGALSLAAADYPREIARLRSSIGDHPVILAGMVGSNRGWADAGYVAAPATLADMAAAAIAPMPGTFILPGISIDADRADVMRGEEIQFLGAIAANLVPADASLCQPGTHCKWARANGGAITDFTTAMTGEMFALLQRHALIGQAMLGDVAADDAFRDGVAESGRMDLLASLFGLRPATLLGRRDVETGASFISGVLIGADIRTHARAGEIIHLIADETLGTLYDCAIRELGGRAMLVDSERAFVAGVSRIREFLP